VTRILTEEEAGTKVCPFMSRMVVDPDPRATRDHVTASQESAPAAGAGSLTNPMTGMPRALLRRRCAMSSLKLVRKYGLAIDPVLSGLGEVAPLTALPIR
jgi:hypothetical protein